MDGAGPGFRSADAALLGAEARHWPADAVTVVDFDGTLLLRNSTSLYLRSLRPRPVARAVLSLLELAKPWRLLPGRDPAWAYRDWVRVVLLTALLPWSPWLWRRDCPALARDHANTALLLALRVRPPGTVVVATYGFRFLVAPLLVAMGCTWPLCVSASVRGAVALRRKGKAAAVRQHLGADAMRGSILVTDSQDDRDFLPLCGQAYLLPAEQHDKDMQTRSGYLPLQYLQHCKRGGENMVVRTILFYDLLCLVLAFVPASGRPVACLLGLLFFQLAFWTVYEIGNWENDVLGAAYEDKPNIPPGFEVWRGRVRPMLAYAWAAALGVPCAACLAFSLQPAGEPLRPLLAVALFGGLLLYLAAVRLVYALYNRVDTNTRVFLYPLMQIAKGIGLAAILPVAPAGFMLLLSVVLVRQMRYVAYRATQMREALTIPVNLHVLICFLLLCAVAVALTGAAPPSFWTVAVLVTIWHLQRSRRPLGALVRAFEWLPNRQHRSTTTEV